MRNINCIEKGDQNMKNLHELTRETIGASTTIITCVPVFSVREGLQQVEKEFENSGEVITNIENTLEDMRREADWYGDLFDNHEVAINCCQSSLEDSR